MIKINMEFKKGILFIRLTGSLNRYTVSDFNNEVVPVVLKHGLKNIVINLDQVDKIDIKGIQALMELNEMVSRWDGKTSLCSLSNKDVKTQLHKSEINARYFETSNELTALEVFEI